MYSAVTPEVISNVAQHVGEGNLSTRQSELDLHAQDSSTHEAHRPKVIKVKCNGILRTTRRLNVVFESRLHKLFATQALVKKLDGNHSLL
jgi:hypothetical protein